METVEIAAIRLLGIADIMLVFAKAERWNSAAELAEEFMIGSDALADNFAKLSYELQVQLIRAEAQAEKLNS